METTQKLDTTLCNKNENGGLKMWTYYLKLSAYNAP